MTKETLKSLCFVFGALRSGTTMFRLMLNNHHQVSNPGEVDFLFDFLRPDPSHPTGWSYDIEAMEKHRIFKARDLSIPPDCDGLELLHSLIDQLQARSRKVLTLNVHRHAARIAQVLPEAKMIHLLRDPRDVARSTVERGWTGNSYYGVRHWIETEQGWTEAADVIPPEQVLTLKFEDLMADVEGELKRVCAFLEVPFSPELLDYYKTSTYGAPDPGISEQWRRKASQREVALIDYACGDLLLARGYTASGPALVPGTVERVSLFAQNKLGRWRARVKKFGPALFLKFYFSRYFGSKTMQDKVRMQMDEKVVRALK
jgi:sulfotransferase family protein